MTFEEWLSEEPTRSAIDEDSLRNLVIADLELMSSMDVKEYTLFQKWSEIQDKFPTEVVNQLFDEPKTFLKDPTQQRLINKIKSNIWIPESPEDYQNLQPELIFCNENSKTWNYIRVFISNMKNNSNIGRNLNFIVQDKPTKKYLGVICISSDFMDLTARDSYIGWSRDHKTYSGKLNNLAICSTIVPIQPLGYNYVGGKLLSLLCLSDIVQETWKEQYGDTLVGLTTTSLYGNTKSQGLSQYDNLKFWKKLGYSNGSISYEPSSSTLKLMFDWLRINHPKEYYRFFVAKNEKGQPLMRQPKSRGMSVAFNKLNIPKELITTNHARGIYFAELYDNTKGFLNGSEEKLIKSFDTSIESLVNIWKTKYAKQRIQSLIKKDLVLEETLFYDDLIFLTWEETKERYLGQVGR